MLVLVSYAKERSGVTALVLLDWCRVVARIHYSNMFFYIRKPNQMVPSMINQWLALVINHGLFYCVYDYYYSNNEVWSYNGVLTFSNRVQNRRNGNDIQYNSRRRRYGLP